MKSKCVRTGLLLNGAVIVLLGTGCQNTLRVRVEKVRGVWSVNRESRVGRALEEAVENLTRVKERCFALDRSLSEYVESVPAEKREVERSLTSGYRTVLAETIGGAQALIVECEAAFRPPSSDGTIVIPRATLRKVRDYLHETASNMESWKTTLSKFQQFQRFVADIDRGLVSATPTDTLEASSGAKVWTQLSGLLAAAEEGAKRTKIGFGGFMTTDVFVINPSDPKYAEILKSASPIGNALAWPFYQNTSQETLTDARVAVSGDSAIMLVMESPGQVRVHQVSMDPTQITRNIGLLVSKATAAAAKYAGIGF